MNVQQVPSLLAILLLSAALAACGPSAAPPATAGPPGAPGAAGGQPGAPDGFGGGNRGGGGPGGQGRQATVVVQVATATFGNLVAENTTAGAIVAETQSAVAAGSSGTVKTLLRQVGDWVEAGTPVIQLDDSQLRLSLRLAQATLDNAKINAGVTDPSAGSASGSKLNLQLQSATSALASAQKNFASAQALFKIGGISGSDFDNAQTQLQNAQANLESAKMSLAQNGLQVETASIQLQQAQLNLTNATIKAPYAGQISSISLHPGEFVGTSTAAFSMVSRNKVISFGVSPSDAPGLALGSAVRFTYNGKTLPTRVTQAPSAPVNGLVPLTAALPSTLNASIGTVGTLSFDLILAQGVLVPLTALQSAENKTFVYTSEQGKAQRREVTLLAESGIEAAVLGIAAGSTVILNAPPGLLVGSPVQAVGAQPPSAVPAGAGRPGQAPQGTPGQQGTGQWKRPAPGAEASARAPSEAPQASGAPADPNAAPAQGAYTGQRRRPPADGAAAPADPTATPPADGQAPGAYSGKRRRPPADGATAAPSAPTETPSAGAP